MTITFFNTLTESESDFEPNSKSNVTLYTCGPTVYNYAHIGNLRAYCCEDLLKRMLEYAGYKVQHIMNITDIEDKIIRGCLSGNIKLNDFTEPYIKAFKEDIALLNIKPAEHYPKASEHIEEIVDIINVLMDKGVAYRGDDGSYYFSIDRYPEYGILAKLNRQELKTGVRISHDEYDKEHLYDFALWKAWDEKDGDIYWETSLGKGRPGWHIECSAMSLKYLGETIDIHMGGVDNIFPHHENEIAQSEAYTGKKFVNYWIHCEHLLADGKKMSKSLGNFYTLRDLIAKGYSPLALRYLYISNYYRSKLNFTLKALEGANNTLNTLYSFLKRISKINKQDEINNGFDEFLENTKKQFDEKLFDDLNTPQALAALFSMISHVNILADKENFSGNQAKNIIDWLLKIDSVLALDLGKALEDEVIPEEIENLINERQTARKNKDFKRADEIRDLLLSKGITLQDTSQGVIWKKM